MTNRIFAIPDIHGRKDLLDQILDTLRDKHALQLETDKLIFLGDMVDRGRDSKGVMDTIRALQDTWGTDRVVALAGNHEWLMIDGCTKGQDHFYLWLMNGANSTLDSFPGNMVPEDYLKWCAALPLYHEEPGFFFSHAPVPKKFQKSLLPGLPYTKQALTWSYTDRREDEEGWAKDHGGGVVGVCGHIHRLQEAVKAPRMYEHYLFLDTGCGCSDKAPLVAVEVKSREVIYAWPGEAR